MKWIPTSKDVPKEAGMYLTTTIFHEVYKVWTDKELLMISRPSVKLVLKRSAVPEFTQRDLRKCMKFIKYISDYDSDMYVYSLDQLLECMYQFGTYSSAFIRKCGIIQKERAKYDEL